MKKIQHQQICLKRDYTKNLKSNIKGKKIGVLKNFLEKE